MDPSLVRKLADFRVLVPAPAVAVPAVDAPAVVPSLAALAAPGPVAAG